MPRTTQISVARRALTDQPTEQTPTWWQHGIALVAVSVLGVGVAGSAALTGSAEPPAVRPAVQAISEPGVSQPTAFDRADRQRASRHAQRTKLSDTQARELASARADGLAQIGAAVDQTARAKARAARQSQLAAAAKAAAKKATQIKAERARQSRIRAAAAARSAAQAKAKARAARAATLPVKNGTIAARFGATGSWSRYHTGYDFSAAVGTQVYSPAAGTVTTSGSGSASGWAGTYVTVRHADGASTLYAHLSGVTVRAGDRVSAGQAIGSVGMTGRTFGPHLHFELYPAGVEPGDVYSAVDPRPWLAGRGVRL